MAYVSPAWPQRTCANGVVTYSTHMVQALLAMGHRPYVITHRMPDGWKEDFVVAARLSREERAWHQRLRDYLGCRVAPGLWGPLSLAASLRLRIDRLVRDAGIHIVEIEEAFGVARRLVPGVAIPVVVRLHGPWFLNGSAQGAKQDAAFAKRVREEGLAIQKAAGVSAPSTDVLRRVREYYRLALTDAEVIPNPVVPVEPADRWDPQGCERGRILFVGRFDRHKGGDTIIDAFARVARTHSGCRLTFVGPDHGLVDDGGWRWSLEQYVDHRIGDPAIKARFEWLGFRSAENIAELRRRAMVTAVCSRYEVFGLTATETMSMGCPLVATKVGGLAEVVQDGRNGLTCRPGDPDDLAQKLLALLSNPQLAANLGRQGAMDVEQRYHPAAVAKQTVDFYRGVIERVRWRARTGSRTQSRS